MARSLQIDISKYSLPEIILTEPSHLIVFSISTKYFPSSFPGFVSSNLSSISTQKHTALGRFRPPEYLQTYQLMIRTSRS